MEELKQCRLQQRNISATVDKLMLCLPGEELEMSRALDAIPLALISLSLSLNNACVLFFPFSFKSWRCIAN